MRALLAAMMIGLVVAANAAAGPPRSGVLVPGATLGGLELGATPKQVRGAWGTRYGVCRDCRARTWYFNYRPFEPQGAGVTFRRGRAVAVFTLWSPTGWHTDRGLAIGDPAFRITSLYSSLLRVTCTDYYAFTIHRSRSTAAIYVFDEQVWGFALLARGQRVCR